MEVPVPVSVVSPEKKVMLARGAASAGTGGVGTASSIGPLRWGAAVACMLVPVVRVVDEWCPPGTGYDHFEV